MVHSPRFQKKKEEDDQKNNNLRYKFISRLMLSANGYRAPVKAFNNLQVFTNVRESFKKGSLFVLNHLRKPDIFLAFRTWRKAAKEFKNQFEIMDRKDLIKIMNKQKDRMEIEYGQKLRLDEKIVDEIKKHRVSEHQLARR